MKSCSAQLAIHMLLLVVFKAASREAETTCEAEHAGDCGTSGSLMTQTRTVRQKSERGFYEGHETVNMENENDARDGVEARISKHRGFEIREFSHAESCPNGEKRWMVFVKGGCRNAFLDEVREKCGLEGQISFEYAGDPDHGGMCWLVECGTKEALKEELTKCETVLNKYGILPENVMIENDAPTSALDDSMSMMADSAGATTATDLWGLDRIDERDIQNIDNDYTPPNTGKGVHVFVADTGILVKHNDFGGRAIPALEALSSNPKVCQATDTSCATDRQGHGTHCAGTIGGRTYGVAKEATLYAVKVLSDSGSGSFSWFMEALEWVERKGKRPAVFSASLGGRGILNTVKLAIDSAVGAGVMVVVAAGNSGRTSVPDACKYTPAFVPNAITVGSIEKGDRRSSFSSYGKCLDIFGPGTDIKSAGHRSTSASATMSGTSMACPHVAGAAALLFAANPQLTVATVEKQLKDRATANRLSDTKSGSPNLLLYVGQEGGPKPTPVATPKPTRAPPKPTRAPPKPTRAPPKPTRVPNPPPGACTDKSKKCATKLKGKCDKFRVQKMCQKTCNTCCIDLRKKCATKLKSKCSQAKIRQICPLTCKVCSNSGSP